MKNVSNFPKVHQTPLSKSIKSLISDFIINKIRNCTFHCRGEGRREGLPFLTPTIFYGPVN